MILMLKGVFGAKIRQQETTKIVRTTALKNIKFFALFRVCNLSNFIDFFIYLKYQIVFKK